MQVILFCLAQINWASWAQLAIQNWQWNHAVEIFFNFEDDQCKLISLMRCLMSKYETRNTAGQLYRTLVSFLCQILCIFKHKRRQQQQKCHCDLWRNQGQICDLLVAQMLWHILGTAGASSRPWLWMLRLVPNFQYLQDLGWWPRAQ